VCRCGVVRVGCEVCEVGFLFVVGVASVWRRIRVRRLRGSVELRC
jgi:hypothetical protein